jgi:hypothetical protein
MGKLSARMGSTKRRARGKRFLGRIGGIRVRNRKRRALAPKRKVGHKAEVQARSW